MEKLITYTIQSENTSQIQNFIIEYLGDKFLASIKPIRYFKDQTGIAFDVREDETQVKKIRNNFKISIMCNFIIIFVFENKFNKILNIFEFYL